MEIVNEQKINEILKQEEKPNQNRIKDILRKAKEKKGLDLGEVAALLHLDEPSELFRVSSRIKQEIYGRRLVFFAPLYVSNYCVNDCAYCGFHRSNSAPRKKLTMDEIKKQVEILEEMGHKRLLLEFGEDPANNPIDYVVDTIRTIYSVKKGKGSIRRVNVNIAATSEENYKKLKEAGIGTYQLFQETYHRERTRK